MDQFPSLLVIALVITFLAWRAARRKNQLIAAQRQAEQARRSYTLEPVETEHGRGFGVVGPDGSAVHAETLDWEDDGMQVVDLDEFRGDDDAGGRSDFAPGSTVELIPSEIDPARVEVWNSGMTARAGTVAVDAAPALATGNDAAGGECVVLWEWRSGGKRTGLRLLLVRDDIDFEA